MSDNKNINKALDATDQAKKAFNQTTEKLKNMKVEENLNSISAKVKDFVIKYGTILITVGVVLGLAKSLVSGVVAMSDNFIDGLFTMFFSASSILLGAFVIFLLIEIKDQLVKSNKN